MSQSCQLVPCSNTPQFQVKYSKVDHQSDSHENVAKLHFSNLNVHLTLIGLKFHIFMEENMCLLNSPNRNSWPHCA